MALPPVPERTAKRSNLEGGSGALSCRDGSSHFADTQPASCPAIRPFSHSLPGHSGNRTKSLNRGSVCKLQES